MLPDGERADRIGEFWGYPESLASELLIDCRRTGRPGWGWLVLSEGVSFL
jgi:hypothetical protein